MPDHLHLFCAPLDETVAIEDWVTFWKRQFRRLRQDTAPQFQIGCFHHRLRQEESYNPRGEYVRENPVRAGLVKEVEEWPYHGVIHDLRL